MIPNYHQISKHRVKMFKRIIRRRYEQNRLKLKVSIESKSDKTVIKTMKKC